MRQRLVPVLAAIGAVLAAGCGAAGASPAGSAPSVACTTPIGDPHRESDGALVVLLDGTLSSAGASGRIDDLVGLLDSATADRQLDVTVGSFGGSDADVRFSRCLDGDPFVAQGNNARTRERSRPALIDAATEEITALQSGYETSDPTTAIRAGIDRLDGVEGTRTLVIHTDGIPTAGCAALPEEVNISDPGLIERLVAACRDQSQLPAADGVGIVIGGIGRSDQDLSAEAVTFLIDLNAALCSATGADCRVDPNFPSRL